MGLKTFVVSENTELYPRGRPYAFNKTASYQATEAIPAVIGALVVKLRPESIPYIRVTHKYNYSLMWSHESTTASMTDASIWRPILPEGCVYFGDYLTRGLAIPTMPGEKVIVAYDHPCFR